MSTSRRDNVLETTWETWKSISPDLVHLPPLPVFCPDVKICTLWPPSRPLAADLLQKQWHARQLNKDFYSLFFTPSLLAFHYQSVNRNRVWKRRELKNAERNEVFSFQMFHRHDDRFSVIVRVLKRLGDRYYIYTCYLTIKIYYLVTLDSFQILLSSFPLVLSYCKITM